MLVDVPAAKKDTCGRSSEGAKRERQDHQPSIDTDTSLGNRRGLFVVTYRNRGVKDNSN
jgi:hypothetical protein